MFGLGITEIIIIVVVIGVLFFGGKKMTEFAKSMGRFSRASLKRAKWKWTRN